MTAPIKRRPLHTLPVMIDELAQRFGAAPALASPDTTLTYAQMAAECSRYARWAVACGLRSGGYRGTADAELRPLPAPVAGAHESQRLCGSAEYTAARGSTGHCIRIVAPKLVIVGSELSDTVSGVRPLLESERDLVGLLEVARRVCPGSTWRPTSCPRSGEPRGAGAALTRTASAVHLHLGHHRPSPRRPTSAITGSCSGVTGLPA